MAKKKEKNKKVLLLALFILIIGLLAGLLLVKRSQDIREEAYYGFGKLPTSPPGLHNEEDACRFAHNCNKHPIRMGACLLRYLVCISTQMNQQAGSGGSGGN